MYIYKIPKVFYKVRVLVLLKCIENFLLRVFKI